MMMRALEAGGMSVRTNKQWNVFAENLSDESYRINPNGELYELHPRQVALPWTYVGNSVVKVVAMLVGRIPDISPDTRVVFMWRDPEEVRQSFNAIMEKMRTASEQYAMQLQYPGPGNGDLSTREVEDIQEWAVSFLRRKFQVTELDYRELLKTPITHFEILRRNGWPIDPARSATVPDESLHRFRKENLTEGV